MTVLDILAATTEEETVVYTKALEAAEPVIFERRVHWMHTQVEL